MSGPSLVARFALLGCTALAALTSSCAARRATVEEADLVQRRVEYQLAAEKIIYQATRDVVRQLKARLDAYQAGRVTEPPVLEVLILSGGGDLGAFGAGFLRGWGAVTDPAWKRPKFDVVTGVSTGALLAPFAFLGDDASYERADELYRNPKPDWITRRGLLFFLPSRDSFVRIDGLKRDIKREFDESLTSRIAAEEGRVLAIGTTNLDFGRQRAWDLGFECRAIAASHSNDRFVDILLASSAIPGAFPPVKIGDYLYVDGAVSTNILYSDSMRSSRGLTAIWAAEYPGVPMPRTRYWVVLSAQQVGPPQITQPTWVNVVGASLAVAVRSSTATALANLVGQLELINLSGVGTKELHVVSIPTDWRPPREGRFEQETMRSLSDLGARMGADPKSWTTVLAPGKPSEPVQE